MYLIFKERDHLLECDTSLFDHDLVQETQERWYNTFACDVFIRITINIFHIVNTSEKNNA